MLGDACDPRGLPQHTGLVPDAGNLALIRTALACLHDQIRSQNGLGTLAENPALDAAAGAHTDDMIARGYFDHDTPDGGTFDRRILSACATRVPATAGRSARTSSGPMGISPRPRRS